MHCIGSREELKKMSPNYMDVVKKYSKEMNGDQGEVELHRPFIDDVVITCPECGKEMHRVPEVIDCWFDSGAMPFAQHHYPFDKPSCSMSSSRPSSSLRPWTRPEDGSIPYTPSLPCCSISPALRT